MRKTCVLLTTVLVFLLGNVTYGISQSRDELAVTSALEWLALVDSVKYAESWDAAAAYFQGAVASEHWEASVSGVRKPLGDVTSRKLISSEYRTTLPGAPDGEYVIIQFDTSFEHKKSAVETVTPMFEDGQWKVSGYYIK